MHILPRCFVRPDLGLIHELVAGLGTVFIFLFLFFIPAGLGTVALRFTYSLMVAIEIVLPCETAL